MICPAALDEITATVRKTAEGANDVRKVVSDATGDAQQSETAVRDAISAMSVIETSAQQISQIIGVIDEITFQTNLLALNAGIEAALAAGATDDRNRGAGPDRARCVAVFAANGCVRRESRGAWGGALSGFMNVTAGVGGPAITLYASASGWEHRRFVGSIQLYFVVLNTASVTAKGLPNLLVGQATLLAAALVAGLIVGHWAAGRVPYARARHGTLALAAFGALATVLKGATLFLG